LSKRQPRKQDKAIFIRTWSRKDKNFNRQKTGEQDENRTWKLSSLIVAWSLMIGISTCFSSSPCSKTTLPDRPMKSLPSFAVRFSVLYVCKQNWQLPPPTDHYLPPNWKLPPQTRRISRSARFSAKTPTTMCFPKATHYNRHSRGLQARQYEMQCSQSEFTGNGEHLRINAQFKNRNPAVSVDCADINRWRGTRSCVIHRDKCLNSIRDRLNGHNRSTMFQMIQKFSVAYKVRNRILR